MSAVPARFSPSRSRNIRTIRSAAPLRIMASPIIAASAIVMPMAPAVAPKASTPRPPPPDEEAHPGARGNQRGERVDARAPDPAEDDGEPHREDDERIPAVQPLQARPPSPLAPHAGGV